MKISLVLGHELPFPPTSGGGVNSLLTGLAVALARQGHSVVSYSPTFEGAPGEEVRDGVRHVRLRGAHRRAGNLANWIAGLPYALRVRRRIEPCDVLSCHLLTTFLMAPHPKAGVVTHTIHRDPKSYLQLFRRVDRIYTGSEAISEEAGKVVPNLADKIKTIHNCVEYSGYRPVSRERGESFRFLYVGRFMRDKGLEIYVRAFIALAATHPDVRLATVGPQTAEFGADAAFVEEMRDLIAEAGLADRVDFIPPIFDREQLEITISSADILCLPSLGGETLNMAMLECLRLSKPLLVSDLAANRPLVEEGVNGMIAKAGDVADWTRAMAAFADMASPELIAFQQRAFDYGRDRFSSDAIAAKYVADFEALIAAKVSRQAR